jgi:uncharacterized phage protein (TIGR01671 family)
MNRQIKFRIWDRQAKAWTENDCSLHCFSNWQIDPFTGQLTDFVGVIDGDRETRYNANPAPNYYFRGSEIMNEPRYVLVQFTGLTDKNGVEIYEGDILKLNELNYEVMWVDGQFIATCPYYNKYHWPKFEHFAREARCSEVVGNIFENPELLKQ